MPLRKILLTASCVIAAGMLALGLGAELFWVSLVYFGLMATAWIIPPVRKLTWLPAICLAGYLIIAAGGILADGRAVWIICGVSAALSAWDAINFSRNMTVGPENEYSRLCERTHLFTLLAAICLGLVLSLPMLLFSVRLPFLVMFASFAAAILGILLAWRALKNKNPL